MPITSAERRFLRQWEEQRKDGKAKYITVYTIGLSVMFMALTVVFGFFTSLPFFQPDWLIMIGIASITSAFLVSASNWSRSEKKFKKIIQREMAELN